MKKTRFVFGSLLLALTSIMLNACGGPINANSGKTQAKVPASAGKQIFDTQCIACHNLGTGDKQSGPDLMGSTKRQKREWISAWIKNPAPMLESDAYAKALLKKYNNIPMPALGLDDQQVKDVVDYLVWVDETNGGKIAEFVPLTDAEFAKAKDVYFDRCSGCHGAKRWGATGPSLLPNSHIVKAKEIPGGGTKTTGTEGLEAILWNGTALGMPPWGKMGILSKSEINLMAKYIQMTPPEVPKFPIEQMKSEWKLTVPVEKRPSKDQTNGRYKDYVGIILRDAGKVAIFDAKSKKKLAIIDTGFAVHILRVSHSGRYFYSIGRDGKVTLIDLWYKTPKMVAEGRTCWDARSIDSSKAPGYEDKYAIIGCYTPNQYTIMDGETLEPISVTSIADSKDYATGNPLPEIRVASIVASDKEPFWVVNLKESGWVYLVDYTNPKAPKETRLKAENFLHDGGWARVPGKDELRYFLVAANAKNQVCVVDVVKKTVMQPCIPTGQVPHPGRGANFVHPKYGTVWATTHISSDFISLIGVDPEGHPEHAWKVVDSIKTKSPGSLFVKSHPKSNNVWFDMPLSSKEGVSGQAGVYDISTGKIEYIQVSPEQITHFEYNVDGTEVWISGWKEGAIYVYDDKSRKLIKKIKGSWSRTPTGKFNVTNTAKDIY